MGKRGQISYFLLWALVIFIVAAFMFSIGRRERTTQVLGYNDKPIKDFIESCIKQTGKDAISFVSMHGGYYDLPNIHYNIGKLNLPYYFYQGINLQPRKKDIEKAISNYVNDNLFFCLRNFVDFKDGEYMGEIEKLNSSSFISDDKVIFTVRFPLTSANKNARQTFDEFSAQISGVRLGIVLNTIDSMNKPDLGYPNTICISCILNYTEKLDLHFNMNRVNQSVVLFTIIDNNTIIDGNPLIFSFANLYDKVSCSNLPQDDVEFIVQCSKDRIDSLTPQLKIEEIPDFEIKAGEIFFYDVNATGYNVTFRDFSPIFDINKSNGIIRFIPNETQKGDYVIWVEVVDALGQKELSNFKITII